ncbi:MAG: cytochrome-c peroxidase [Owenweeksia sp.]|nr:cytochrome-c peroxidase [Owenweeksia sp.]
MTSAHEPCGSCHHQPFSFTDSPDQRLSTGVTGLKTRRNSMVLFNLAWQEFFFWDGRTSSLEEQSLHPIKDPVELNNDLPTVISRLENDSIYPGMFKAAFGSNKITEDRLAKAIAQFERTIVSANSKFDRVVRLEQESFTPAEQRGILICTRMKRGTVFTAMV